MEVYLIVVTLFSVLPGYLARSKGRSFLAWFGLGLVFNPFLVCIVVLVLPNVKDYENKIFSYYSNIEEGINVHSPIRLESYSLFTNHAHDVTGLVLNIRNLSNKEVSAVDFIVEGYSNSGSKLIFDVEGDYIISMDDLSLKPKETYSNSSDTAIRLLDPSIEKIHLTVRNITFADGTTLVNEPHIEKIKKDEIPHYATALARTYVRSAWVFAQEGEYFWMCPCGSVNLKENDTCFRCGSSRDETLKVLTRDNFRPIWNQAQNDPEHTVES